MRTARGVLAAAICASCALAQVPNPSHQLCVPAARCIHPTLPFPVHARPLPVPAPGTPASCQAICCQAPPAPSPCHITRRCSSCCSSLHASSPAPRCPCQGRTAPSRAMRASPPHRIASTCLDSCSGSRVSLRASRMRLSAGLSENVRFIHAPRRTSGVRIMGSSSLTFLAGSQSTRPCPHTSVFSSMMPCTHASLSTCSGAGPLALLRRSR
mmetsp:Transcript_2994/g.7393  ORF Transcript_2994/g.7393 Transcript_2994/m.7393 type:complete len:212 (+) Transcript_2994:248-883(+)